MKKYLVLATLWITAFSPVVAQGYLKGSHILDHWFVGAQVGFNSKLTHNPFMTHLNPHTSVRVGRDLFPAFSLIAEATSFHNDQLFADSPTPFIKAFNFDILGQVNLNNLIWGYTGRQRFCEVRFLLGWGVNHINGIEGNRNDFISKIAFDVAFRLDRNEAWEAFVEPALNYNLNRYSSSVQYNPHYAAWQLAVGAHYYFRNVNGTRRFRQSVDEVFNIEPKTVIIAAPKPEPADVGPKPKPVTYQPKARSEAKRERLQLQPDRPQNMVAVVKPDAKKFERDEPIRPKAFAKPKQPIVYSKAKKRPEPYKPVIVEETPVPAVAVVDTLKPVVEEVPVVAVIDTPKPVVVEEKPVVKETPVVEEKPVVEEIPVPVVAVVDKPKPVVVDTPKPVVEEKPAVAVVNTPKPKPVATPTPAPARAKVKTEAPAAGERSSEGLPVITFAASSNAIPSNQSDLLAQVAVYLRNHPRAKLVIHGTQERAKAVSDMLVRRYGVVSHRLSISAHANAKAVTFTE